jgi:hypothetical protein
MKRTHNIFRKAKAACLFGAVVAIGTAAGFWRADSAVSTLAEHHSASVNLRGEKAADYLKRQGIHESLEHALTAARRDDELADPQLKITANDGAAGAGFGQDVAVSGNTVVVGAPFDDLASDPRQGAVYVFVKSSTGWMQQQKLRANDGQTDIEFGTSVAIEGDTIVVGAPGAIAVTNPSGALGAAYVFTRTGSSWMLQQRIVASDGERGDEFGHSVSLSGGTIVVGTNRDSFNIPGKAYVFTHNGSSWQQQQILTASDGAPNDLFGRGVQVSGDTVVVGAFAANIGSSQIQGAAYIFTRTAGVWSERQKLVSPTGSAFYQFGFSVAVSGETIAVGEIPQPQTNREGAVFVYINSGANWTLQQKLTSSEVTTSNSFGSVSLDGDKLYVGDRRRTVGTNQEQGATYHFERRNGVWSQQRKLTATDGNANEHLGSAIAVAGNVFVVGVWEANVGGNAEQGAAYIFECGRTAQQPVAASDGAAFDRFGSAVAVSGDTVVVGVPSKIEPGSASQGAAYVFVRFGAGWIQQAKLKATPARNGAEFGHAVDISGDTIVVGAWKESVAPNDTQGAAYVFVRNGTQWTQQARLLASDGLFDDQFGSSVAIDGNSIAIGAPLDDTGGNANQGSVYVFTRNGATWTEQTRFSSSNGAVNDNFGNAVDINADSIAVGAFRRNSFQGEAYVFTRSGSTWSQQQNLTANDGTNGDEFGFAISLDSNTLAVGAHRDDTDQFEDHGSVYIFTRSGTTWSQQPKVLPDTIVPFGQFGSTLGLDGDTLLIGQSGGLNAAWVYVPDGNEWVSDEVLLGVAQSDFGKAVGLSGVTVAVGSLAKTVGGNFQQGDATVYYSNCSTAPTGTFSTIIRRRCKAATPAALGSVADLQDAAGSLTVTAETIPAGITLTNLVNTNGVVTANIGAECTTALGTKTIVLKVSDSGGGIATFNVLINVIEQKPADFDGDGKSDISIWRQSNGNWWILQSSNNGVSVTGFGLSGDRIVPGDYDGDGKTEIAVFRPTTGIWYWLKSSDGSFTGIQWGLNGDIPVAADFDGDSKTDLAVFRPSNGVWYVLKSADNGFIFFNFGLSGDKPVVGDYDGDGRADFAVFRPSTSVWYLQKSTAGFAAAQFGIPTDKPVEADYDGDGKTDIAVYRPAESAWYLLQSNAGLSIQQWGLSGDIPASGDYDGDGKSDLAVFRPSNGNWHVQKSSGGTINTQFGTNGDVPVESGYFPP